MITHVLKTLKPYYDDIISGKKTFEVRKDDRHYEVGNILGLIEAEIDSDHEIHLTGREVSVEVVYILRGEEWGIKPGFAVLGIKVC